MHFKTLFHLFIIIIFADASHGYEKLLLFRFFLELKIMKKLFSLKRFFILSHSLSNFSLKTITHHAQVDSNLLSYFGWGWNIFWGCCQTSLSLENVNNFIYKLLMSFAAENHRRNSEFRNFFSSNDQSPFRSSSVWLLSHSMSIECYVIHRWRIFNVYEIQMRWK